MGNDNTDHNTARSPNAWATKPEQRYAERQANLATHYGLDIESRTTETDSAGEVHYLVTGDPDGEPVVLLHGVSTTAATWLSLAPALTDEYRLIVPDRPGRGLSAAPSYRGRDLRQFLVEYLVELLDALELDRPHVVGNSLGGQQAFLLAIDYDRVDRLCLVGAPGGVSKEFPLLMRLLTVRGVNRLLYWLLSRGDPIENAREAARQFLVVDIECPTGFVWGSEDSFWPPEVGRPLAGRMADAEFHELPDHGHMPWMEPGDEAETLVRSFLEG